MIRHCISVTALIAATPLAAQTTTQDALDERYDRALAAGYKALFLCSAIANAERNRTERSPESVEQWELSGIQEPLDTIIGSLEAEIGRDEAAGRIRQVSVTWADDMPPRIARHGYPNGCVLDLLALLRKYGRRLIHVRHRPLGLGGKFKGKIPSSKLLQQRPSPMIMELGRGQQRLRLRKMANSWKNAMSPVSLRGHRSALGQSPRVLPQHWLALACKRAGWT